MKDNDGEVFAHPAPLPSELPDELIYSLKNSFFAPPFGSEWVVISNSHDETLGGAKLLRMTSYVDRLVPVEYTSELGFSGKDLFDDMKLIYSALRNDSLGFDTVTFLKTNLGERVILSLLDSDQE